MISELLIILALILLNGLFSASEIAVVSSKRTRLQLQAKKGVKQAQQALKLHDEPNNFLSTVQIGITLIGILTGIYGGASLTKPLAFFYSQFDLLKNYSAEIAFLTVVIGITFLTLVLGELLPKRLGLAMPERFAMFIAYPMMVLSKIVSPFVWLLTSATNVLVRVFHIKTTKQRVSEEEIKALIDEGAQSGAIEEIEHEIVDRVFTLGDRKAITLMTHRSDLQWLDIQDAFDVHKAIIAGHNHNVYVVSEGDLDNVLGIITTKTLLNKYLKNEPIEIRKLLQPVNYVYENSNAYNILKKFRKTRIYHALVLDEYGTIQGLISMKDILNSLVGDISENDTPSSRMTIRQDGSMLVEGRYLLDDLLEELAIYPEEDLSHIHTLAGLILAKLNHLPEEGEAMVWQSYRFEVVDMDGQRIDKVLISQPAKE